MAGLVLRNRLLVVLAWAALAAVGMGTLGRLGPRLDYLYSTPGEPGYESNLEITARFGIDPAFESILPVLELPPDSTMATQAGRKMAAATFATAQGAGPMALADYATTHDPMFILDGGRATWALISIANPDYGAGRGVESRVQRLLMASTAPGTRMTVTGFAQMLSNAGPDKAGLVKGAVFGLVLAFTVLVLVYGSPIAILPILMAIPAICVTFLCVFGMTYVSSVSYFVEYMVVLLSLGISVDFSLIIVVRWREERLKGLANDEAVIAAVQSAGRAVALSGMTAAVGLLSLAVLPVPFLRSVGYGGMLIPFVAVCVAVTLLPVCLSWAGPALDRFNLWSPAATIYSRGWERWTRIVLHHQWKAACVGFLVLAITATPALSMKTGEPLIGSLPQAGAAPEAFHRLQANGIPSAVDFPIYVMTHGGAAAARQAIEIARETPGVYRVLSPDNSSYRRGADALLTVIPTAEGSLLEGKAIVGRLRARLSGLRGGPADVGGSTAEDVSFTDAVYGSFPLMLSIVSLVTLAILMFALRSVLLAIKAVLLNVVSLGSAFGFMVFFWQQGHGSSLVFGMPATNAIRAWIPTVVFASLFGLSMDYEVFVLARIREEFDRTGATREAIAAAMARTGRLVSCAALILMVTFLSLSIGPNQIVKISATTLAVGIIMDAMVIRCVLVPALVALMGRWNWWMPAGLDRLLSKAKRPVTPPGAV